MDKETAVANFLQFFALLMLERLGGTFTFTEEEAVTGLETYKSFKVSREGNTVTVSLERQPGQTH